MPFVVVYDASVFYPDALRDLHIRVAGAGLFQAKWTRQIVAEALAALGRNRPDIPAARLDRLGALINDSVPDCLISGYEPLIENLKLPDPDDRHVLAAAIKASAQVIVTANLRDFPQSDLAPWDIEAQTPDEFMLNQISVDAMMVFACIQQIADSRKKRPKTVNDVLGQLERHGLIRSVASLRSSRLGGTAR